MKAIFAIFLSLTIVASSCVLGSDQSRQYVPIGCFRDRGQDPRPLPTLLADLRKDIDWYNLNKTIDKCSRLADQRGFKVFGIQFYGECWSGREAESTYSEDGRGKKCVVGVGQEGTYYVYKFLKKAIQWSKAKTKFIEGTIIRETSFKGNLSTARTKCRQQCQTIQGCKAVRLYDLNIGLIYCTFFSHVTAYTCPQGSMDFKCMFASGESWERQQ